jgi:hypothetical protein
MSFSKFEIEVTPVANHGSKVVVDGVDVTNHVKALALFAHVGEPTTLQLHTYSEGRITGEGVVEVLVENGQTAAVWLRQVDRKAVDERAMKRGGWGDSSTLTDNVIEVLLEMLSETESSPHP